MSFMREMTSYTVQAKRFAISTSKKRRKKDRYKKWAFLFISANLVLFLIFFAWPACLGIYYSFTDYNGNTATFIGLDNNIKLFQDERVYEAMFRTFLYTLVGVRVIYCITLLRGVCVVGRHTRGPSLGKTVCCFPWIGSAIVVGVLWRWMFGEGFGFISYMIQLFGGDPLPW